VAESYFELLTEQQGLPAKPFDPLEELRRLRQRLALRIQQLESPEEIHCLPFQEYTRVKETLLSEPVSLETVVKQVGNMKKTLAIWQRSRARTRSPRDSLFRARPKFRSPRHVPAVVVPYPDLRNEKILEKISAGLSALGMIGVIFGTLSFCRGWDGDLSFGTLVCVSGSAIIAISLVGHLFASRSDCSLGWGIFPSSWSARLRGQGG
jgi:hypothetical protein